tara:strand:+ start:187 stop:1785 length:1599 start_codon:yes stop_codon:yes gene_type:complete
MTNTYHVIGPPGTGKTTYLARQARRAVEKYGPDSVLIVSLTRAAAAEISGRDTGVPRHMAGTLHSICYHALDRPTIAESKIKEWNTAQPRYALDESQGRSDLNDASATTASDDYLQQLTLYRLLDVDRQAWRPTVQMFAKKWFAWLEETGYIDFTGLIEQALEMTHCAPGAPQIILADEVQDFSRLEMKLLDRWGQQAEQLIIVGDPDQSIYEFRGANPNLFIEADVDDDHRRVLSQSYRVPQAIHAVASQLVQQISRRKDAAYEPTEESGEVTRIDASFKTPDPLLKPIRDAIAKNQSFMILAACTYMLHPTVKMLREEGIPFWNPYRRQNGAWNPLTPSKGTSASSRVLSFLRPDEKTWGDDFKAPWPIPDLRTWTKHIRATDVLNRGARDQIDAMDDEATYEWDWFEALFKTPEHAAHAADLNLEWFAKSLIEGKAKSYQLPLQIIRQNNTAAILRQDPHVVVGTIHSIKGGEADVVAVYPDLSMRGYEQWAGEGRHRDSIVRQFYVAVTRARQHLLLPCQETKLFFPI